MPGTRTTVACFGEALIDFLAQPADGGPRLFAANPGGAPANVAVGVSRLGGDARFVGMLGQDMFGDLIADAFRAHGVDISATRRTAAAPTALAFVALDAGGDRSFSFYRPPAADLLFRAEDFDDDGFASLAVFHCCSNSLTDDAIAETTLHGLRRAGAAGAIASVDLNLRPALWPWELDPRPRLWELLSLARLVKLSREELEFLAADDGEDAVRARLFAGATDALVVTDGGAPLHWWTRDGHGQAPTFGVTPIDTTAAGDAFVAGLLARLVARGIDARGLAAAFADDGVRGDLLRHAAATGALATTRHGAFDAMPSQADVAALLGTRG